MVNVKQAKNKCLMAIEFRYDKYYKNLAKFGRLEIFTRNHQIIIALEIFNPVFCQFYC
jgi:hypothetical protein